MNLSVLKLCKIWHPDHKNIITFWISCRTGMKISGKLKVYWFAIRWVGYSSCAESNPEHEYLTNTLIRQS